MNSFSKWRRSSQKTQCEIAKDLDISQAYLSRVLRGQSHPSLNLAADIAEYTGGAVGIDDWPKFKVLVPREAAE